MEWIEMVVGIEFSMEVRKKQWRPAILIVNKKTYQLHNAQWFYLLESWHFKVLIVLSLLWIGRDCDPSATL